MNKKQNNRTHFNLKTECMSARIIALCLVIVFMLSGCQIASNNRTLDASKDKRLAETNQSETKQSSDHSKSDGATSTSNISKNKQLDISNRTIYEVNLRQYTQEGTFEAFMEHIPRLDDMGVGIVWFMPIHPISVVQRKGTLGSYYSVADYKGINPEFGTAEDFRKVVEECHKRDMLVVLDWVANHTGWDNPWIVEHPEWYTQDNGQIIHPQGTDWTDVADLDFTSVDMRQAMIDSMVYWVKEFDVDGFRCDVAGSVPTDFWEDAVFQLNQVKSVFMLAEDGGQFGLLKVGFQANYNWELLGNMNELASGKISPKAFKLHLVSHLKRYPESTYPLNFITNHDENSWNKTEYERLGEARQLMSALTFTLPGLPLIYSGQEAGLDRALLFFEKDQIDWSNLNEQKVFKQLTLLKASNMALLHGNQAGSFDLLDNSNTNCITFYRENKEDRLLFIGNLSHETQEMTMTSEELFSGIDYITQQKIELTNPTEKSLTLTLQPWEYIILVP